MKNIRNGLILLAALLFVRNLGFAAAVIDVNNVCQTTPTCTPGTLAPGGSDSASFNFNFAVNGDTYNFTGNYLNTLNAAGTVPQENLNLKVTLVSTAGGAGSSFDDITVTDLLDDFQWPYTSDTFFESGTFEFGGSLAPSSNAQMYLMVGLTKLPLLGPFHPYTTQTASANAPVNTPQPQNDPLQLDLNETFEFGAGSLPGAFIQLGVASTIPEPSYAVPMAAALLGFGLLRFRRIKNNRSVL